MSPFAVISMNDEAYRPLAMLTWEGNKIPYCKKHGYAALHFGVGERDEHSKSTEGSNHWFGFLKIQTVLDVLEKSEFDWVFFSECDAMITNMYRRLEDLVDNGFHVLLSGDFNGLNAGNFLSVTRKKAKIT